MSIPKIIHQTYRSESDVPVEFSSRASRMRKLNPGWNYSFYDDAGAIDFITNSYSQNILRYYLLLNPCYGAARADFFRYLLLYRLGGVYLDIKSEVTSPLDQVLHSSDTYLLSHWRNLPGEKHAGWGLHEGCGPRGEFQQWHIVASAGHPFLKAVILAVMWNIDNYDPAEVGVGRLGVVRVTGPAAYTRAIRPILGNHDHRIVDVSSIGFEYSAGNLHYSLLTNRYDKVLSEPVVIS